MGHRGLCGRDSLWAEPWRMVVLRKGGQGSLQIEGSPGRDTQCLYPVINFVAMWAHKCYVFCHLQLIFLCLKKSPEPKYKTFNWHFQFFEVLCTRAAGIIVHIVSYPRGALLGPGRDWGAWRILHGQRRLVEYSSWSHKELDTTEQLTLTVNYTLLWILIPFK